MNGSQMPMSCIDLIQVKFGQLRYYRNSLKTHSKNMILRM